MENEEKRRIIERTWGPILQIFSDPENQPPQWENIYDALEGQAIAIEAEIEHTYDREGSYGTQFPMTIVKKGVWVLETFQGHEGTEGPYLFIGLPLAPKEEPE